MEAKKRGRFNFYGNISVFPYFYQKYGKLRVNSKVIFSVIRICYWHLDDWECNVGFRGPKANLAHRDFKSSFVTKGLQQKSAI